MNYRPPFVFNAGPKRQLQSEAPNCSIGSVQHDQYGVGSMPFELFVESVPGNRRDEVAQKAKEKRSPDEKLVVSSDGTQHDRPGC